MYTHTCCIIFKLVESHQNGVSHSTGHFAPDVLLVFCLRPVITFPECCSSITIISVVQTIIAILTILLLLLLITMIMNIVMTML